MMTAEEKEFVDAMMDKLPPVIARHQVDRFIEFPVIGTEDHRNPIDGCFQGVVDAYAESSSDVRYFPVSVDRR